jgi:hypothetical protein
MVNTLKIALNMTLLKMSLQAQNMSGKAKKFNKRVPEMHLTF